MSLVTVAVIVVVTIHIVVITLSSQHCHPNNSGLRRLLTKRFVEAAKSFSLCMNGLVVYLIQKHYAAIDKRSACAGRKSNPGDAKIGKCLKNSRKNAWKTNANDFGVFNYAWTHEINNYRS